MKAGPDVATTTAVKTIALTKRYGRDEALSGVDLQVPREAVYVLVGANGAGKSTLFQILMNMVRADSGVATVFGMDSAVQGPEVRAHIGYVPEYHVLPYRQSSGRQLIDHVSQYYPTWDHAYAARLVAALELCTQKRIAALSKGEARRLQLLLALAHRPPVLLLDEPTDGLDPVIRNRSLTLLAEHLADAPTTLLMSTHHIHEVERLADHVGILRSGRLIAQLSRDVLRRTVKRYRIEVPAEWEASAMLRAIDIQRSSDRREVRVKIVAEEEVAVERLIQSGAEVREVSALSLEDATLAILAAETGR
ncbi:MAG: ABC-type multidrug transport system, ATPase component [Gemmatimonadetes bacterium]|nr:ABC-type multidrug transport system, ATPase component [Gemmatimonadota bacterium]